MVDEFGGPQDLAGRSYLEEGPRRTDWLAKGVVKQHRTLGSYLNMLIRVGFAIRHVEEWGPTAEQIAAHPGWADERQRPPFLLIAAKKPGLDRRPHAVGARNADNKQATGQSQARSCEFGKYIAQYPTHADVRSAMPRAFGRDRSSQRRARRRINRFSPKMAAQSALRSTISGRPFARAGPAVRISFPPAGSRVRT